MRESNWKCGCEEEKENSDEEKGRGQEGWQDRKLATLNWGEGAQEEGEEEGGDKEE